ncbi:MAG: hypothetical protein PVF58_21145 [Candidatus Methanofastidiosia archaeon]|jgi:uncharacterized protein YwgA
MLRTYENKLRDKAKILLLLNTIGEVIGRINFQKIVYLLQRNQKLFNYNFKWGYHGPYSRNLILDIDTLVMSKLVEEDITQENDRDIYRYRLTSKGRKILNEILNDDPQLKRLLKPFEEGKKQIKKIGFDDLITYISVRKSRTHIFQKFFLDESLFG